MYPLWPESYSVRNGDTLKNVEQGVQGLPLYAEQS